jgi:hypothetical protein
MRIRNLMLNSQVRDLILNIRIMQADLPIRAATPSKSSRLSDLLDFVIVVRRYRRESMDEQREEHDIQNEAQINAFAADAEAPKRYSRSDEEFASEIAEGRVTRPKFVKSQQVNNTNGAQQADQGRAWGITALILAIASWFIWPTLLAPAAVITGFVAFRQGRRGFGAWAIVIGLIAFIVNIAATPFFR